MKALKRILSFLIIACSVLHPLGKFPLAQEQRTSSIKLLHSDNLEIRNYKDNTIVNLIGNVHLQQDSTTISSDRAIWYKSAGQVVLIGDILVDDGAGRTLKAKRATYYRKSGKIIAIGDITASDDSGKVIIRGNRGKYIQDKGYFFITGNPKLVAFGENDSSAISITASNLEYFSEEQLGVAKDSVRITKGNLIATGDKVEYYRKVKYAKLYGNPKAELEGSELIGDTLILYLGDNEKVSRISVRGKASAIYNPARDSTEVKRGKSKLTGEKIDFYFTDENPDSTIVVGRSTSYYQPSKDDSIFGVNEASGDTIKFFIKDKKIQRALVLGGAKGSYRFKPDNIPPDSVVVDTVNYMAGSIDYLAKDSSITLLGNSNTIYKDMDLQAYRIIYIIPEDYIYAEGDSIVEADTSYYKDPPILSEGSEKIVGYKMEYNIKNKKGKIIYGNTEFEKGYYFGEDVRKASDKVLYVKDGVYTSCDLIKPHYCFKAKKMKIIAGDKVIAKPIVMYIGELPVAALPYYVFPIKKGRHSGFTTFELGNFERGERFIRDVGYYWAASQYWDVRGTFDYFEASHTAINITGRYALRYRLSGSISSSQVFESSFNNMTEIKRRRWQLSFSHNQIINQSTTLSGSGTFMSDKSFTKDISFNPDEIRNRQIHSQFSLNKKYDGASLTIAADQNWNLDTDIRTEKLPVIRYSLMNRALFPYEEPKKKNEEKPKRWYNNIYYSYSFSGQNYRRIEPQDGNELWKEYATTNHKFTLSSPLNLGGFLTLSPGGNVQESWYYIPDTKDARDTGVETNSFKRRLTYGLSMSAKTTLYGLFAPNVAILEAVRHIMTPSVGYSWKPEFKKNQEYYQYTGVGASGGKINSISLGLGNLFQAKGKLRGKEYKLDLLSINFSTGYNFIGEGRKWSNLRTAINSAALIRNFSLSGNMEHSFYSKDSDDVSPDFIHPRLISFNISASASFSGKAESGGKSNPAEEKTGYFQRRRTPEKPKQSPWRLSISTRYSENRGGFSKSITKWVNINYETPITSRWRISYRCRYDVENKRVTEQEIQIYRNMHCWEGYFVWIPNGYRSGYYLKINILELPDIKVEKSEGGIKGRGYF